MQQSGLLRQVLQLVHSGLYKPTSTQQRLAVTASINKADGTGTSMNLGVKSDVKEEYPS